MHGQHEGSDARVVALRVRVLPEHELRLDTTAIPFNGSRVEVDDARELSNRLGVLRRVDELLPFLRPLQWCA